MRALMSKNVVETILRPGQIVAGQYRVDHLVGQGGMAAVWAGTNEHTGKRVALKVILLSLSTTREAQNLFRSEALAASRVNHPNVVTVFDVIEHEGMACIVMELLDGEPLGSYIARKGFLSVNEATALLLPAMRGVAAANAQGVIHRDLKPQNIFICIGPDGRIVTTKVLDFGISVIVERVMDPLAGPVPGLAMGTPAYMSPEHILGAAHVDERADVYGFGVLLYEALTGQTPFPGEPGPALFDRVLHKPAPPVTLFRPDLAAGFGAHHRNRHGQGSRPALFGLESDGERSRRRTDAAHPGAAFAHATRGSSHARRARSLGRAACARGRSRCQEGAVRAASGDADSLRAPAEKGEQGTHPACRGQRRSNGGSEVPGVPLTTSRDTVLVNPRPSFRSPSPLRGWRGLAGAGLAVALGFFAVWTAMRGVSEAQTGTPAPVANFTQPAGEPIAYPPVPAVASTAIPATVADPAPLAASLSALVPKVPSTRELGMPTTRARATPASVAPSRSRLAHREASKSLPSRLREARERDEPARAPSRAPGAGASARSAAPLAGRLYKDDF